MKLSGLFSLLLMFVLACACGSKQQGEASEEGKIIAKAGDEQLDEETFLSGIVSTGFVKDSAFVAIRFVEKWATEALFYQEAMSKLNTDEVQIEKQVEDYRRTLVNHIYQTKVIEANLDTSITQDEIEAYYNDHRDNFILKDNIIKVNYLKIVDKSPVLAKIKKLLYSPLPKDREVLFNLCSQNAENYYMNDSTWLFVDDIKKEIPSIREYEDYNFQTGRIIEVTEEGFFYYLKIKDVKTKNSYSPLNFEIQNIRKFILNNRKTQLINQYKQQLLEKAKADQTFKLVQ